MIQYSSRSTIPVTVLYWLRSEHVQAVVLCQYNLTSLSGTRAMLRVPRAITIHPLKFLLQIQIKQIFVLIHVDCKPAIINAHLIPR